MTTETKDIFIKDLLENYTISIRAFNVCNYEGLKTVRDLHKYLINHNGVIITRNCGKKTNKELIEIDKEYYFESTEVTNEEETGENLPDEPRIISEEGFRLLIKAEFEKLGVRAKNALLRYFDEAIPGWCMVKEHFIIQKFQPNKLRNVGALTVFEIQEFVNKSKEVFYKVLNSGIPEADIASIKLKEFSGIETNDSYFLEKITANDFPIISFTEKYLADILKLNEIDVFIYRNYCNLLDRHYTLDEIGKKFKLSRERIRQKRHKILTKCYLRLRKLTPLIRQSKYEAAFENRVIVSLPDDISEASIRAEVEKAGSLFSAILLGVLLKPKYYAFTKLEKTYRPESILSYEQYTSLKKIRGAYLIDSSIISKKALLKIYHSLLEMVCQKQEEDALLDINTIIKGGTSKEAVDILSLIITRELELTIKEGKILIPRNSNKLVYKHVQEALEIACKPCHISEIHSIIKNKYPDFESTENSLKTAIMHHRDIFIHFGRSSTFGLKIWEKKNKNIKGGTIRDIVEEFLNKYNEPCHISAITEYVNKYRKTDETNVMTNLKLTKEKRFHFLKNAYVGLASKDDNELIRDKPINFNPNEISLDNLMKSIFTK